MDVGVFRIRFSGQCLPGFDEAFVRQTLAQKLGFSPHQIASIFRGRPVTLKNDMEATAASVYETRLRRIGMDVRAEAAAGMESTPLPVVPPPQTATAHTPQATLHAPQLTASRPKAAAPARGPVTETDPDPSASAVLSGTLPAVTGGRTMPGPAPIAPPAVESRLPPAAPAPTATEDSELMRICPRCGARIPAARPCPHCSGRPQVPQSRQAAGPRTSLPKPSVGESLSTPTAPTPETQYLSTLLAEQELMADHSTDRRTLLSLRFSGRMHGLYYLWWIGITYLLMRWLNVGDLLWRLSPHGSQIATPPSAFAWIAGFALLFQAARLSVLRLHDLDMSGLWASACVAIYLILGLFVSVTLASLFFQFGIVLLIMAPGDRHNNRFGSPPQSPDGTLEWFDPGRRCNRMFYLSRSLGVVNAALLAGMLLNVGARLINGIVAMLLPAVQNPPINQEHLLIPIGIMAASLSLRLMISRLHDIGLKGSWILPYLAACWGLYVPMITPGWGIQLLALVLANLISMLVFVTLCTIPGKPSSNRFGKLPKETWQGELWRQIVTLAVLSLIFCLFGVATIAVFPFL